MEPGGTVFEMVNLEEGNLKKENSSGAQTTVETGDVGFKGKHDPFGNEDNAEVKYKTMAWW